MSVDMLALLAAISGTIYLSQEDPENDRPDDLPERLFLSVLTVQNVRRGSSGSNGFMQARHDLQAIHARAWKRMKCGTINPNSSLRLPRVLTSAVVSKRIPSLSQGVFDIM